MYIVQVEIPEIVEDLTEPFLFTDRTEGTNFVNHLRDLYGLDVNLGELDIDTYDSAIERMVEVFGPSDEEKVPRW